MPDPIDTKQPTSPTAVPVRPTEPVVDSGHEHILHTYEADLALAMDTTDATVVQELLQTAHDRETAEKEKEVFKHQRTWYTTGGVILCTLAIAAAIYGFYYYRHLTVSVTPTISVGVFASTAPIIASDTTIGEGLDRLTTVDTLPEGKPLLVPILSDSTTRSELGTQDALFFMDVRFGEPFIAALSLARLGVMNTGTDVSPFLIFSTPNPEIATKEFLIAEPTLLATVAPVLGIDLTSQTADIGTSFTSTYMYNLPVRTLTSTDIDTKEETILLYYGYATDTTIVVATNPTVLKTIYDTIIRQR